MKKYDFDLFILGAGSAGVRAGRIAANYGARVGIAEEQDLGGTCVNAGCIPKKLLLFASHFSEEFLGSNGYGWTLNEPKFNWHQLIINKNQEIERLGQLYKKILNEAGVEIIEGKAILTSPTTIKVNNRDFSSKKILIATGSSPVIPNITGKEYAITSNEAFHLDSLPEKIIIVGGGYIGVEFAGIFNGFGVDTTLMCRGPLILNGFDNKMRELLSQEIQKKGVKIIPNSTVTKITKQDKNSIKVCLANNKYLETNKIMYAIGRKPNTSGLGLKTLSIDIDSNGAVIINDRFQSSVSSVYAIGDVTNRYNLTPVAIAEGVALANSLYGSVLREIDYTNIPTCVFSQPNLASVGLTEQNARSKDLDISVYMSHFKYLKHSLTNIPEKTFIKLIVENKSNLVVGAHMVGHDAGEIIQGIAIAMKAGATKADFDSTLGIHPTAAEEFVTMKDMAD